MYGWECDQLRADDAFESSGCALPDDFNSLEPGEDFPDESENDADMDAKIGGGYIRHPKCS